MTIDDNVNFLNKVKKFFEEIANNPSLNETIETYFTIESLESAINIMHKYQKIAEIVTNNELEWGNTSVRANALLEVKKVIEDGNVD